MAWLEFHLVLSLAAGGLVGAVSPVDAGSPSSDSATQFLHAARVGEGDPLPVNRMLHSVWTIESSDGPSTSEEFIGRSGSRAIVRRKDLFQPIWVFDLRDGVFGERDAFGWVELRSAKRRAIAITENAIEAGNWLSDPGIKIELAADAGVQRLRITPADGVPALVTIDSDGGVREARVPWGSANDDAIYGDFVRDGAGVRPRMYTRKGVTLRLVSSELIPETALPPLVPGIDWRWPAGVSRVIAPLSRVHGDLVLSVKIGGTSAFFVLDSGNTSSVVDVKLAKALALKGLGECIIAGGPKGQQVELPKMCVDGACMDPHLACAMDLRQSGFAQAFPTISGILGWDFLSKIVVVIDYGREQIALVDRSHFVPEGDDVAIPSQMHAQHLLVPVTVNGRGASFVLDTGDPGGLSVNQLPDQTSLVTPSERRFFDTQGARYLTGSIGTWQAWVSLMVGPFEWKHVVAAVHDPTNPRARDLAAEGFLGLGFLRHFRTTLDFQGGRMWLKQIAPFGEREDDCSFGLRLEPSGELLKVESVRQQAAAAKAGLQPGDTLLSVNGLAVTSASFGHVLHECAVGENVRLQIARDGKTTTVRLTGAPIP